jgi:xylulokinase
VRDLLLGVDVGTTTVKASIFAPNGDLVAEGAEPSHVEHPRDGWVEQGADEIWRAASAAIRRATAAAPPAARVMGVGVCGHSPTLILLDAAGRPVRRAIVWQDRRAAAEASELAERLGERAVDLLGGRLPAGPSFPHPRLLWLARHEPDVLRRAAHALDTKDWVNYRLTGVIASDPWSAKGLANMATGAPIAAWRELLGVDPSLAPPTRPASAPCGRLRPEAAAELGLEPGTVVAIGWTDGGCAMLGTGCFVAQDAAYEVAGTSEVIGAVVPFKPSDPRIQSAPGPDPRWTLLMGPTQAGGASLQWLGRLLRAEPAEIVHLADQSPPGANGLLFLPYLEGERAPIWDPAARGMLFGLASGHGRADVARAVLEGVAHSVRHVLETIEETTRRRFEEVRVCGGGSREPLWNQIKADVLGRTVRCTARAETSSLGAAMLGGVAAGVFANLEAGAAALARLGTAYHPRRDLWERHDSAHRRYVALYPRVRDLFDQTS